MGYQALLFCPDERTARTVTQVLSELEFSVETCAEPFIAVKKLMGEHFDAVVVDCDNEQNATLLFKSARNSTSNQASLAVAVVEGQAGVAKAFRIGANLVLTKPINVEQAKGTLRVARGLLRKGEPGKAPVSAPAPPTPAPAAQVKPAAPKPPVSRPPLVSNAPAPKPPAAIPPVPKPLPKVAPPAPVAKANPGPASDDDLLELNVDAPKPQGFSAIKPILPPAIPPAPAASKLPPKPVSASFGAGAASAPAPAREVQPDVQPKPAERHPAEDLLEAPAEAPHSQALAPQPAAPTFTFGGANEPAESSGGSKKIVIGIIAAVVILAAAYFGWAHFKSSPAETPAATAPAAVTPAAKPSNTAPAPTTPSGANAVSPSQPVSQPAASSVPAKQNVKEETDNDDVTITTPSSAKPPASSKSSAPEKPAEAPLVVKGGAAPVVHTKPAAVDAPAPSIIGLTAAGSAPPPSFVTGNAAKPILQTLNVSQGVSQGLLIKKVQPQYPQGALSMHVEGSVELLATISRAGSITAVKVVSGEPILVRAATEAVKQWKYKPYLLNGQPVEIQTQITINFKLPH